MNEVQYLIHQHILSMCKGRRGKNNGHTQSSTFFFFFLFHRHTIAQLCQKYEPAFCVHLASCESYPESLFVRGEYVYTIVVFAPAGLLSSWKTTLPVTFATLLQRDCACGLQTTRHVHKGQSIARSCHPRMRPLLAS